MWRGDVVLEDCCGGCGVLGLEERVAQFVVVIIIIGHDYCSIMRIEIIVSSGSRFTFINFSLVMLLATPIGRG